MLTEEEKLGACMLQPLLQPQGREDSLPNITEILSSRTEEAAQSSEQANLL